jgi:hypothetical protein
MRLTMRSSVAMALGAVVAPGGASVRVLPIDPGEPPTS